MISHGKTKMFQICSSGENKLYIHGSGNAVFTVTASCIAFVFCINEKIMLSTDTNDHYYTAAWPSFSIYTVSDIFWLSSFL